MWDVGVNLSQSVCKGVCELNECGWVCGCVWMDARLRMRVCEEV